MSRSRRRDENTALDWALMVPVCVAGAFIVVGVGAAYMASWAILCIADAFKPKKERG